MRLTTTINCYNDSDGGYYFETIKPSERIARAMTYSDLKAFHNAYRDLVVAVDSSKVKGYMRHIIYADLSSILKDGLTRESQVIWTSEPGIKSLIFSKGLSLKSGYYHIPRLVWSLADNKLSVYACFEDPKRETILYKPPFYNVYDSGGICLGSTVLNTQKAKSLVEFTDNIEEGFYNSLFTHSSGGKCPLKDGFELGYKVMQERQLATKELIEPLKKLRELWK